MPRIEIRQTNIYIDNSNDFIGTPEEQVNIIEFNTSIPILKIFENSKLIYSFTIEPLTKNPDLIRQFLHCHIRILNNSGVMIDGVISKSKDTYPNWDSPDYEAIRFQPFFLSDSDEMNNRLKGAGLFRRGLHFPGKITPTGVRNICICDSCKLSFSIQHFHAGFSNSQYFYSSDSSRTLLVPYGSFDGLPEQLQENISNDDLFSLEQLLPVPSNGIGTYKYFNNFRCPHCNEIYIDFKNDTKIRANEYYGIRYLNKDLDYLN